MVSLFYLCIFSAALKLLPPQKKVIRGEEAHGLSYYGCPNTTQQPASGLRAQGQGFESQEPEKCSMMACKGPKVPLAMSF